MYYFLPNTKSLWSTRLQLKANEVVFELKLSDQQTARSSQRPQHFSVIAVIPFKLHTMHS